MTVLFGTAVFGLVAVPPLPVCAEPRGATAEPSHEPMRPELPASTAQDTSTAKPAPDSGGDIDAALTPDPQRG